MHNLHKRISPFLALSLLQFFVPVLNVATGAPCCDAQEIQCCQAEYPSRMVCCAGDVEHDLDDSAPLQATLQKTTHIPFYFAAIEQSIALDQIAPLVVANFTKINLLKSNLFGNQLYKRLATYLI